MKNLNKAILIALGMALPLSVMASPDDDVTIRMMEVNEHATEAVTSHIELPEIADDHAGEHAAEGLETASNDHDDDMDQEKEHDADDEKLDHEINREEEHDREMDREEEHELEIDVDREDRKDVEHKGIDREEVEREGIDDIDHGDNRSFDAPGSELDAPGQDHEPSSHDSK
ncbi:MAG: hypothetical protein BMS9Abin19_1027 [Gammaproteobacteria bacterium]|nr:MAG: hypothetical protein BMS9Abin19_1027 [Gammaproteobacteria bacterium]